MDEPTFAWLRVAAFALVLLPALVTNLRTGAIANRNNAIVLLAGLAVAFGGGLLGAAASLPWLFWIIAAVVLLGLAMTGTVTGGVAKFLVALLPWFTDLGVYVAVVAVGMVATGLAGYVLGRERIGVLPALYLAGLGALAWTAA